MDDDSTYNFSYHHYFYARCMDVNLMHFAFFLIFEKNDMTMPFIYITYIIWSAAICDTMAYSIQKNKKKCNLMKPHCLPLFWIMNQTTLLGALVSKRDCTIFSHFRALGGKAARIILTE